jgi:hypothetical protein
MISTTTQAFVNFSLCGPDKLQQPLELMIIAAAPAPFAPAPRLRSQSTVKSDLEVIIANGRALKFNKKE